MARDDRSLEITIAVVVIGAVVCLSVTLRLYVRGVVVKALGWDDGLMVLATFFYCVGGVLMIVTSIKYGLGRKAVDLPVQLRITGLKVRTLSCGRADVPIRRALLPALGAVFLLRVAVKPVHIRIIHLVMVLCVLVTIMYLVIILVQCQPISYMWTRTLRDPSIKGACYYTSMIRGWYVYNALVTVCDLTMGILPIFIVRRLQMPRATRIAVAVILSFGAFASAGAIARFAYIDSLGDFDFLYGIVDFTIWTGVEIAVGISAGSLATLGPLLRRWTQPASDEEDEIPRCARRPMPRRPRHLHPLSLPLTSLAGSVASQAVVITKVHGSPPGTSDDSSQVRLALQDNRGTTAVDSKVEQGIYRACEVSQISDVESGEVPSIGDPDASLCLLLGWWAANQLVGAADKEQFPAS
ncbi:hypothetical protein BJX70DRAFT_395763 [Aspergillus crustosus]